MSPLPGEEPSATTDRPPVSTAKNSINTGIFGCARVPDGEERNPSSNFWPSLFNRVCCPNLFARRCCSSFHAHDWQCRLECGIGLFRKILFRSPPLLVADRFFWMYEHRRTSALLLDMMSGVWEVIFIILE